jgi:ComF family protein
MILDFLFPKYCLECKKEGIYICDNCITKVLDGTFDANNFSIFKYKGVIKKALISLKYKFTSDVSEELVERCIERLRSVKIHDVILIPIPLYWRRENWRGFNQSELLGEKIAKKLNWEFIPNLLIRNKNTTPQVGLENAIRKINLIGVFKLNPDINIKNLKKRSILIFDDVYTTGSTIKEARNVLEVAGFKKIYSLTIAR